MSWPSTTSMWRQCHWHVGCWEGLPGHLRSDERDPDQYCMTIMLPNLPVRLWLKKHRVNSWIYRCRILGYCNYLVILESIAKTAWRMHGIRTIPAARARHSVACLFVDLSSCSPQRERDISGVVLGAQWGDEGKGKLVDILAQVHKQTEKRCRSSSAPCLPDLSGCSVMCSFQWWCKRWPHVDC